MSSDWEFLDSALFSEGLQTDISSLDATLLGEIKKKMHPIRYTDIVVGNFIVNLDNDNFILYKVIETNGASFNVATSSGSVSVFYATDNNAMLLCRSAVLGKEFHHKISGLDIKRIIESFRENQQQSVMQQPITVFRQEPREQHREQSKKKTDWVLKIATCCLFD